MLAIYKQKLLLLSEEKIFLIAFSDTEKIKIILYTNKLKNDIFLGIMDFNSIFKNQYLITSRNIFKFRFENQFNYFENLLISLNTNKNHKTKKRHGKFEESLKERLSENCNFIIKEFEKYIENIKRNTKICEKCAHTIKMNNQNIGIDINENKVKFCPHTIAKKSKFSIYFEKQMGKFFKKMHEINKNDSNVFSKFFKFYKLIFSFFFYYEYYNHYI